MQDKIRNFCIISHIDHGKSTLADRLLEITGTIPLSKMRPQYLDMMALERERGITIKMQPVRMLYEHPQNQKSKIKNQKDLEIENWKSKILDSSFILNLIDTPGHVDFSYEVSRGLAAVEGAVLLVDATKGIQAQTIYHLAEAKKQKLVIIPAINKIDMPQADIVKTKKELQELLGEEQDILEISGKLGTNVEKLLQEVVERFPPPPGREDMPLRALIFDSEYDAFKGVIAFVRIIDGQIKTGEKIYLMRNQVEGFAKEVGYFRPEPAPCSELKAGEIGYIATGIKEPGKVRVGDTITNSNVLPDRQAGPPANRAGKSRNSKIDHQNAANPARQSEKTEIKPLPGYQEPKPVVFASIYPENADDFSKLQTALYQLKLTDPALSFEPESKTALGQGFRCGFLGGLHAEIVVERLQREFNLNLVVSRPQVVYKIIGPDGKEKFLYSSREFPENPQNLKIYERWVTIEVVTPKNYLGPVLTLLESIESHYLDTKYLGDNRLILIYEAPLREIMVGFYDRLKGISEGFASLNYEIADWREAELVKMDILIAGREENLFAQIVPVEKAQVEGRKTVQKLKQVLPPQLFAVALQAKVGGDIIARETISAKRKDVIAPLYGGDYTRKRKLLEIQKKGKKELKEKGRVIIPTEVYLKMLRD